MTQILTRTTVTELARLLRDYIKVGEISSINPQEHTARVVFPDDDNAVSYDLPVLCRNSLENHDYAMPDVGEDALCLFLPGGAESGVILGTFYAGDVTPPTVNPDQRMIEFQDGTIVRYDRGEPHSLDIIVEGTKIHIDRKTIDTHGAETQNHSSTKGATRHDDTSIADSTKTYSVQASSTVTITANSSITLKAPHIVLDAPTTTITGNLTQGGGTGGGSTAQINGSMKVTGDVTASNISLTTHTHTGVHGETSGPH